MSLVLYIGEKNLSSWSMRPWLALKEKGVPFEERLISLYDPARAQRLSAVSPNAKVPVLHDGELVVTESIAILEHLEECYPTPPLLPRDRALRAETRMLMAIMHAGFADMRRAMSFDLAFHPNPPAPDAAALADVATALALFESTRAKHERRGPFLVGDFTHADIMFAPVVHRLRGFRIDVSKHPRAAAWIEALWARPSVRAWMDDAHALGLPAPHP